MESRCFVVWNGVLKLDFELFDICVSVLQISAADNIWKLRNQRKRLIRRSVAHLSIKEPLPRWVSTGDTKAPSWCVLCQVAHILNHDACVAAGNGSSIMKLSLLLKGHQLLTLLIS